MPKTPRPKPRDWRSRISIKPEVCFGKPCIKGTRIWVSLILDFLADGKSVEEVLDEYPQLTREDVRACIAYGASGASGKPLAGTRMNPSKEGASCTMPPTRYHARTTE